MASFIGELKRRNVFRVAVSYAIVAWLSIQIAATVLPTFDAPRWVIQTLTFVVILGFPAAVALAWAFEITPEGIKAASASTEPAESGRRRSNHVVIGLLLLAVAYLAIDNYILPDRVPAEQPSREAVSDARASPETAGMPRAPARAADVLPNSVAVLPFANLSPDPDNAYFAAGIHETVLNELAKISDLNVIARTAVLRYADGAIPIEQIARELRVEVIMEGSVQYAENRVRITAQLIDPATGSHLWSENYDRDFADLFAIQSDIASRIATTLEAQLLPSERASIARPLTDSREGQALYLRALATVSDLSPGTPPELSAEFQGYLDAAIALDPKFARAYALKAVDYASYFVRARRLSETEGPDDWERLVRENAGRALELDPTLGLAHAALGRMHEVHWREVEARSAYERAYELSPNDRDVLIDFSFFNTNARRYPEAIELAQRAIELDPVYGSAVLAFAHTRAGDLRAAAEVYRALPGFVGRRAVVEAALGNEAQALALLDALDREPAETVTPTDVAWRAYAYGRLGREAEARGLVARLVALTTQYRVSPGTWAWASLALRDRDRALEYLMALAADRVPNDGAWGSSLGELQVNAYNDPILDEREFVAIRNRLGFAAPGL
jgi:TolB-like protein